MLDPRHNDLLRGLAPPELELVLPELQRRGYAAGQTILHFGEPGDCLYLIASGLVRVDLPNPGGDGRTLAQLGPGQVFGELSILTGQPRTAEVRALVETVAYTLSISSFFKVAGRSPTMLLNLARVMAERLGHMTRTTSHRERRALVVLVGPVPPLVGSLVATNLVAALAVVSGRRSMLLDVPPPRATPLPGREWSPNLEQIRAGEETLLHLSELRVGPVTLHVVNLPAPEQPVGADDPWASPPDGEEMVSRALGRLTRTAEFIVVNLTGRPGALVDRILPMASRAYLVAATGQSADAELATLARQYRDRLAPDGVLGVIALSAAVAPPRAVRERVQAALGVTHVEVLPGQAQLLREAARVEAPMTLHAPQLAVSKDITRLAREVAGLRVGLALGGGAARGVSHVGVVAALDRLGVPIDAVAGTSIGALVGAGVSMGMDMRQVEETMNRLLELWGAALRPALPRVALLSGKGLERILQQLAGDVSIEELPIPYGAVAADLDTGRTVYMRRGSVARAVRASVSLPVIFPPVVIDGYTLVDGGVTNLVPTQLARLLGADVVLACDVSEVEADQSPLEFAEPPPGQAARRARSPNILQTYLRCIEMMKAGRGERDCLLADLTFRPRIPQMGWKEFQKVEAPILAGEQAVAEELENLRELLPWLRVAR